MWEELQGGKWEGLQGGGFRESGRKVGGRKVGGVMGSRGRGGKVGDVSLLPSSLRDEVKQ